MALRCTPALTSADDSGGFTCSSFHLMLSWSSCLEAVEDSWMSSGVSSAESSLTSRTSWRKGAISSLKVCIEVVAVLKTDTDLIVF